MNSGAEKESLLSQADIAKCWGLYNRGDFECLSETCFSLGERIMALSEGIRKKRKPSIQDESRAFLLREMIDILTPVSAYSQMICTKPGKWAKSYAEMNRIIAGYLGIFTQYVDVFIEAGVSKSGNESACIEDMVKRAIAMTESTCAPKHVFNSISEDRHYVSMGFAEYFPVHLNIMRNAWRSGASNFFISVSYEDLDEHVTVAFANDGKRIDPEIAEDVFRDGYPTLMEGSGIGLSACRRYVEAAGGKIGFGLGSDDTIIYIRLPASHETKYCLEPVGK